MKRPGFRSLHRQGGGVVIMFGMVARAGLRMLGKVEMNRRNMVILAVSLAIGVVLQAVLSSLQHLPKELKD